MLNVLHGRFAANPAQNRPSHIMKGKKAQMSTVSHWDWIRHPHLSLLIHKRPRSAFLSALSSVPLVHTHQTLRWSQWVTSVQTSTLKTTSVGLCEILQCRACQTYCLVSSNLPQTDSLFTGVDLAASLGSCNDTTCITCNLAVAWDGLF